MVDGSLPGSRKDYFHFPKCLAWPRRMLWRKRTCCKGARVTKSASFMERRGALGDLFEVPRLEASKDCLVASGL